MSKILLIDDEVELLMLLKNELEARGHRVLTAYRGEEGIALARQEPDLILLDIMMPDMNGFEVCRAIRDQILCPILFLSAKQEESDKIHALTLGGDDFISKPFGLRELLARIEANLRREQRSQENHHQKKRARLYFADLSLDLLEHRVRIGDTEIPLSRREYEIVELLALRAGQVFSREHIYERVWGCDAEGDAYTVVEHIRKIRKKFAQVSSEKEYISTVWGIGYRWERL